MVILINFPPLQILNSDVCSEQHHTYHISLKKVFLWKILVKFLHPSKFMCTKTWIPKDKIYVAHITYAKYLESNKMRSVTPVHKFYDSQKETSKLLFSNSIKFRFLQIDNAKIIWQG